MSKWDFEEEFEIDNDDYFAVIMVHYWGYEIPAKLTGHPDRMYPGEGEDNLELITMHLIDDEGKVVEVDKERADKIWAECEPEILKELQDKVA